MLSLSNLNLQPQAVTCRSDSDLLVAGLAIGHAEC